MDIRIYLKGILRWWWLIILSTGIAAGVSYYVSSQQAPVYQTSTTLLVGQVFQKSNPSGSDFATSELLAESYAQVVARQPILQATINSLGLDMDWAALKWQVYAYSVPQTQLLVISVSDTSPDRAVAIADEIAYQLILQSPSSPENQARQERSGFVQSQLDDLEQRIQTAQGRVIDLEAQLSEAFSAREIQDLQTEMANLGSLINNWQANYSDLLSFLEGGDSPNYLTVIEPAQRPYYPVSPNIQLNVALAAAVGFALAFGAALLLEFIDDTIKSVDDLGASTNMTVLGSVSRIDGKEYRDKLITSLNPFSPVSESYRILRTNLQFMSFDQTVNSIMLTSANPGEGKSVTAANLAVIMAQADLKTILIDADLRRPTLHKIFQVGNLDGLTDMLRQTNPDIEGQLKESGIDNLHVITSGPLPPNPSELLSSQRMVELMNRLKDMADVVIFDSPPVLAVTDAAVLSSRVDGVILIAQAKRTRRGATRQALQRLEHVGANILGCVLNQLGGRSSSYNQSATYYTRGGGQALSGQLDESGWRRLRQRLPVLK